MCQCLKNALIAVLIWRMMLYSAPNAEPGWKLPSRILQSSPSRRMPSRRINTPLRTASRMPSRRISIPLRTASRMPSRRISIPLRIIEQYAQPQPNYYSQSPEDYAQNAVVTTGAFFGLNLLFSLPAIGWIICLIMAFAPKNKNIKNFARSKLIWIAIGIILGIIAGVVFSAVFKELGIDMDSYFSGYGYTM